MPVARHWRLSFTRSDTGSPVSVKEVAFLDSGSADLSVGGTATASSASGAATADKAFDKDTVTVWQCGVELTPTLSYDHGADVNAVQVRINFSSLGSMPVVVSSIRWMTSADGTTWSTPAPMVLVSGSLAANTEATYNLIQASDFTFNGVEGGLIPFAGSTLPDGMPTMFFPLAASRYKDMEFGGNGRVVGTVKRDSTPTDIPLKRRVRLHRESNGLLIQETWSDPVTGAYAFVWIDERETYTVLTYDHEHNYRAVVADNLTLANGGVELMA